MVEVRDAVVRGRLFSAVVHFFEIQGAIVELTKLRSTYIGPSVVKERVNSFAGFVTLC